MTILQGYKYFGHVDSPGTVLDDHLETETIQIKYATHYDKQDALF
jgi:hypothetical protein